MRKTLSAALFFCLLALFQDAEARFPRGTPANTRGDVICDASTGTATGVGSGTCMTTAARCYGDLTSTVVNVDTTDFSSVMRVYGNVFTSGTTPSGDVGKTINIPNGGGAGPWVINTVGSFNGTYQDITMTTAIRGTQSNNSVTLTWGTNDAPAFATFNDWALRTWQASFSGLVEMYIPSGKTCQILSAALNTPSSNYDPNCGSASYGFNCNFGGAGWSKGIRRFLMNFSGSSVVSSAAFGTRFDLLGGDGVCHRGLSQTDGCTATTANASIGDTSVTLLDTTKCSRFTVGNYVFMTGYDTQGVTGAFGYPPNPAFYDHVKVTSLANCATLGIVNLDRALTNNYLSTWPRNNSGSANEADAGGPATLYALAGWWDSEAEYRGGTFSRQNALTNDAGRKIVFRDITWSAPSGSSSVGCPYATQNTDWTVIGGDWTNCVIETDKIVVNMTLQGGSFYRLDNQSMSPRNTTITNSNIAILNGTGRNFTGTNMTVTTGAGTGPTGYGRGDSWSCTNCSIAGDLTASALQGTGTVTASVWGVQNQAGSPVNATMSGGVLTLLNSYGAAWWAVPGTNFTWSFGSESQFIYQVQSVTQDATNQYITTNCVGANTVCGVGGGLPISSGGLTWRVHPAPKFNCVGCAAAGSSRAWSVASDGPTDAPLFSYANYNATVSWPTAATSGYQFDVWGKISGITATVNTPYAGGGSLNFKPTGQFVYGVTSQTGSAGSYVPSIDLKTGGTRTLLPDGTGGTGADTNTTPFAAPLWAAGLMSPVISSQPAWAGNVQITITTDQGVVNP